MLFKNLHSGLCKVGISLLLLSCMAGTNANAAVQSFSKETDGVNFKLDKGALKIKVCSADIIEVKYTTLNSFLNKESLVVTNKWAQPAAFTVADNGSSVVITTAKLKVAVDKATNAISYLTKAGQVITAEDKADNKSMQAATIAGINTYNCSTQFISPADEGLFGLGCHPLDSLSINYKGRNQVKLQCSLNGPLVYSSRRIGI